MDSDGGGLGSAVRSRPFSPWRGACCRRRINRTWSRSAALRSSGRHDCKSTACVHAGCVPSSQRTMFWHPGVIARTVQLLSSGFNHNYCTGANKHKAREYQLWARGNRRIAMRSAGDACRGARAGDAQGCMGSSHWCDDLHRGGEHGPRRLTLNFATATLLTICVACACALVARCD